MEVRIILRGKIGFYGRSKGELEKWSWRREEKWGTIIKNQIMELQ